MKAHNKNIVRNPEFQREWGVLLDSLDSPPCEEGIIPTGDHAVLESMQHHFRENLDHMSQTYEGQLVGVANGSDLVFSASTASEVFDQMNDAGTSTPYLLVYMPSRSHSFNSPT